MFIIWCSAQWIWALVNTFIAICVAIGSICTCVCVRAVAAAGNIVSRLAVVLAAMIVAVELIVAVSICIEVLCRLIDAIGSHGDEVQ